MKPIQMSEIRSHIGVQLGGQVATGWHMDGKAGRNQNTIFFVGTHYEIFYRFRKPDGTEEDRCRIVPTSNVSDSERYFGEKEAIYDECLKRCAFKGDRPSSEGKRQANG